MQNKKSFKCIDWSCCFCQRCGGLHSVCTITVYMYMYIHHWTHLTSCFTCTGTLRVWKGKILSTSTFLLIVRVLLTVLALWLSNSARVWMCTVMDAGLCWGQCLAFLALMSALRSSPFFYFLLLVCQDSGSVPGSQLILVTQAKTQFCSCALITERWKQDCSLSQLGLNMSWFLLCSRCGHPCRLHPCRLDVHISLCLNMTIIKWNASEVCWILIPLLVEYFKYFSAIGRNRTSPFPPFFLSAMSAIVWV